MRSLILTAAVFAAAHALGQNHFCGTTEMQNQWFLQHPELKANFEKLQQKASEQDKAFVQQPHSQMRTTTASATFTVPVVFHILHTGGGENIGDAQVIDAVSILNRDYSLQNADTANVVYAFKNLIGNAQITYSLATKDPNGNCTNGIVRHWDVNTDWSGNFTDYAYTWDPTKYLNVYVVRSMGGGAAGYTYLPGSGIPTAMDAIVILSGYVGSIGTGMAFTSRALTHEVGHWFNLSHTWGNTNQPGVACGDDGVTDTPVTEGHTACTLNNAATCTNGVIENIQNYMEYAYCSNMFTMGQVNRMQTAANSTINGRNNLTSATNLANTGLTNPLATCIPMLDISSNTLMVCSGHTLSFNSYTYNANPTTYAWSANNGATVLNGSSASAQIVFNNSGNTTVSCVVTNSYGNSSKSIVINVSNGVTQVINTNMESFEAGVVPANWTVINPTTPAIKWDITQDGASSGSKSMYVKGESLAPNSIETLETPSYDFKNNQGAQFTFYYAYAKASASNKDVFKVQASSDCGGTWSDVWTPSNQTLANNSGGMMSTPFIAGASGWVMFDLVNNSPSFFTFLNESNVRLRFYFQEDPNGTGYGNRIYLDDINFSTPTGINALTQSVGFSVYPNPSQAAFNAELTLSEPANIGYQVVSVTGAVVINETARPYSTGQHQIAINQNNELAKGIYILNMQMNGVKMSRKLIVE